MGILKLNKINDEEINNFIDKAYQIEINIEKLTKNDILESKNKILTQINELATNINNSKTKFLNEKNEIHKQLQELSDYYTSKYFIVGFD